MLACGLFADDDLLPAFARCCLRAECRSAIQQSGEGATTRRSVGRILTNRGRHTRAHEERPPTYLGFVYSESGLHLTNPPQMLSSSALIVSNSVASISSPLRPLSPLCEIMVCGLITDPWPGSRCPSLPPATKAPALFRLQSAQTQRAYIFRMFDVASTCLYECMNIYRLLLER